MLNSILENQKRQLEKRPWTNNFDVEKYNAEGKDDDDDENEEPLKSSLA